MQIQKQIKTSGIVSRKARKVAKKKTQNRENQGAEKRI